MSRSTSEAVWLEEELLLSDEERAFVAREVEIVVSQFAASLSDEDLEVMRESLLRGVLEARRAELVRAATPRSVDESGEILRFRPVLQKIS
jgi:hypothetical protein